jgi:flavodoxin
MKKAAIIYRSKRGTTHAFAEAVAEFFNSRGIEARALSVENAQPQEFADVEYLLLGCWTSGHFLLFQHPDKPWTSFARTLPPLAARKIGLFTTYKIATGGMFKKMSACLGDKSTRVALELKSRSRRLSDDHRRSLDAFLK